MRIEFISEGFQRVLASPGVDALCSSVARRKASEMEASEGVEYQVARKGGWRPVYLAKTKGPIPRLPRLDHDTWMRELWPRVGGAKWRPH